MKRCLVVDLSYIGDVLMSSPCAKALARHFDEVDVLTLPCSRVICDANPHWSNVYTKVDVKRLRERRYDLAVNLHTSLRTNLMVLWRIGAKRTLGYNYKQSGLLHSIRVPLPHRTLRRGNRVDEVCDLLEEGLDIVVQDRDMILDIPQVAKNFAGFVC